MRAIVLAAGKGVRMRSDLPKVLHQLAGKSLVRHVVDNIRSAGIDEIAVVVGYRGESVIAELGQSVNYAWQREQLGTGHAVLQAAEYLEGYAGTVLVACGDAPLISSASFSSLAAAVRDGVKAAVLTMQLPEPRGYGRIIRDAEGAVRAIVEEKDASETERAVTEVNTGTYVFNAPILFDALGRIGNNNAQNEYYLTDVIKYINSHGFSVAGIPLGDPGEGRGVNSPEELALLEKEFTQAGSRS